MLVREVKASIGAFRLDQQLKSVYESYKALSELVEQFESTSYTIKKDYTDLLNTNFKEDSCDQGVKVVEIYRSMFLDSQ